MKTCQRLGRGKQYKDHLWNCGIATTIPHFQRTMTELKEFNNDTFKWLAQIPPHQWPYLFFLVHVFVPYFYKKM